MEPEPSAPLAPQCAPKFGTKEQRCEYPPPTRHTYHVAMSGLRISEVQAHERPRERLFALGASSLTLVELVAILVGTGLSGTDAMEVGESVLAVGGGSLGEGSTGRVCSIIAHRTLGR